MTLRRCLARGFLLMVSLPRNQLDLARAAVEEGADTLKVHLNCHHYASGTLFGSWPEEREALLGILGAVEVPVGLVPGAETLPGDREMEEIREAGFDYLDLFSHHLPPRLLGRQGPEWMVAVDSEWTPEEVGELARLGVGVIEASIVPRAHYRTPLSARDLARYASLVRHSPVPVIIPTQKAIRPEEVAWLRRLGAAGVGIGAVVTGLELDRFRDTVRRFRQAIDRDRPE